MTKHTYVHKPIPLPILQIGYRQKRIDPAGYFKLTILQNTWAMLLLLYLSFSSVSIILPPFEGVFSPQARLDSSFFLSFKKKKEPSKVSLKEKRGLLNKLVCIVLGLICKDIS